MPSSCGRRIFSVALALWAGCLSAGAGAAWPFYARIATPWDYPEGTFSNWEEAVAQAVADGANVILDWLLVSDYWKALYEPLRNEDLMEMERRATYIHAHFPGVRYLVYVAPLEYVTPDVDADMDGAVDPGKEGESLALQHPDWLQVGIDGRSAVFYGADPGMPFWVCDTCEDVWLTPANPEYRELALEQARGIASTGVDGVWLDVPFLRFDFGPGWRDQWPTFDPWAVSRFEAETGYSVPDPPSSAWPDWDDPSWRAFVRWRYRLTAGFVAAYRDALREVNPDVILVVESSVGPDVTATQQGSSTLDLLGACDLVAHEVGGPWRSAEAHYYMWLRFLADLLFFRHTDGANPSWLLSYVKAGEPDTLDVARLHAGAVVSAGMNYYTSGNETMAGIPDAGFRRELFAWLDSHGDAYYGPEWEPYANVALVYSQNTLDFLDRGSWSSDFAYHDGFTGMAMMLLESHIPFVIVTERELGKLSDYDVAILPLCGAMSAEQARMIRDYVAQGGTIIATGPVSLFDAEGVRLPDFQLADVFGVHLSKVEAGTVYTNVYGQGRSVFLYSLEPGWVYTPELAYFWAAEPWEGGDPDPTEAASARDHFLSELWARAGVEPLLSTDAPPGAVFLPCRSEGKLQVRVLNLYGVDYGDAVPAPLVPEVSVELPRGAGVDKARRLELFGDWAPQGVRVDGGVARFSFPLGIQTVIELSLAQGRLFTVERETGDVRASGAFWGAGFEGSGADVAEWVPVSEEVEPGDVLEIDPGNPGYYRKARGPCSALVAGVVSGEPGFVLGHNGEREGRALLALMGTVPVKVTDEGGPIRPGDLLVVSSIPGYAMRWDPDSGEPCGLVGKALEPWQGGRGIVLALLVR